MVIREAEEKDLERILKLYMEPDIDNGCALEIEEARRIFRKMKSYPDYSVYVAEADGAVIGTFALAVMDNLAHMGARSGLVEDVIVSAGFRGKGVGTEMMKKAISACREKGCYKVALSSNLIRTKAHKLYEDLGFKIHGYSFLTELE